jgi:5-methylcytosine-specific restriction endonuclease McrA
VACGEEKPDDAFYPKRSRCKVCHNIRVRSWQSRNADRLWKNRRSNRSRYNHLRFEARRRGVRCELTYEDFVAARKGSCTYCSGPLPATGGGLDRKDNADGYKTSNVVPCCARCNTIKSDALTYEEMLQVGEVLKKIYAARKRG